MKIEEFCTPIKVLALIFIFFVSFLFLPSVAQPNSQLSECDIRPHDYSVVTGDRMAGDLNSVYEDDGETLLSRAVWYWLGTYYEFYIDVFFYFSHVQCDELYIDFFTLNNVQDRTVGIVVYYVDGTLEFISQKASGYHTVVIDDSKEIDRVLLHFVDRSYIVSGGDRYLYVDLIAAKVAGDNSPPIINIDYQDGDGTDANPGIWNVYASDGENSIDPNSIYVWIDSQFAGNTLGEYNVPRILGEHTIVVDVANIHGCPTTISDSIRITDDDMVHPVISYTYTGDGTDHNSGEVVVSVTDQSGLYYDPSGIYPVPNTLGIHNFVFGATDNDDDRPNDRLTRIISISITIVDDDETPPEIDIQYIGSSHDGDPGYFEWSIYDLDSEISEIDAKVTYESTEGLDNYSLILDANETGSWNLPSDLGIYTMEITATDNDNDRTSDTLARTMVASNVVIDDDGIPPEIEIQYVGSGFDNDAGYFEWSVYDTLRNK